MASAETRCVARRPPPPPPPRAITTRARAPRLGRGRGRAAPRRTTTTTTTTTRAVSMSSSSSSSSSPGGSMDQMRVTTVDVACVPGTEAAFAAASIANARSSVEEEDNARFDVLQDVGDDAKFVLVEIYDSPEGGASSMRPATLVPIRPRSRGERRSLRTLSPGASLRPGSLAFQRPPSTPFISASDAHELHPDVRRFERRTRPSTLTSVAAHKETAHYARWRDDVADAMAVPRRAGKYVPVYPWRGLWGSGAAARRKASARSTPEEASFLKPRRDDGDRATRTKMRMRRVLSHTGPRTTAFGDGGRRSLRTFAVVSLRPGPPAFNPRPRRLSTPLLTPLNSTPTFARIERP